VSDAHSVSVCSTYAHVRSYSAGVKGSPLTLMKPGGRAAALLQRQHVQQSGLAGAGGAEDGQHVPGRHLTLDVLQKRLGGRALHRDGVVQALEGEAHLLALHGCHGSERPGGDARAKKQTRARRVRARGCVDRVDAAEKKRRNVALVALCA
jgi:hypothetical protein